jgi:hypothetical protein
MSPGDIIGLVALSLAVVGATIAYRQLRDSHVIARQQFDVARGQFILAVDQSLWRFERIRRRINDHDPPSDKRQLRRYIAALERIGYLYKKGYLEEEALQHCYGPRLKSLINSTSPDYVVMILTQFEADRTGWQDFMWMWEYLKEPLKLRDIPHEISSTRPTTAPTSVRG